MDDFPNINADGGVSQPRTGKEEAWHAEMRRRANDVIRVLNPTDKDFYVKWETQMHRFPANSTKDVPRYVATAYCRDMKVAIIESENKKRHDDFLAERRTKGFADYKSKYEENQETYMTPEYPRTDDYKKSVDIYDKLWIGVVYEFGKDDIERTNSRAGEVDITPDEVKILQGLNNRKVSDTVQVSQQPVQDTTVTFEAKKAPRTSKKDLEAEVTND